MGNIHFNAGCFSLPSEINKSSIINTQPQLASPLITLSSSSASSFDVIVLISQPIVDIVRILSNHSSTNYRLLNNLPTYTPSTDDCKYSEYNTYKQVSVECDPQMTFSTILKQFSLTRLFDINTIKICSVDEVNIEETQIEDIHESIFDTFKLLESSATDITLQISLCGKWFCNTLNEIFQMDLLINDLITETRTKCKSLKYNQCLKTLRMQHGIIKNEILSTFVDIDALIDKHGNAIANVESCVLPYLSTNENQILKQLTKKINKMDRDLQSVRDKWSIKSIQIERYLKHSLDKRIKRILRKYKLWNTEQVIHWLQFVVKDSAIFDEQDIETLKIANIAGINIYNINRDILEMIHVYDEILQNIIITSVHSLIEKYDKTMERW